MTKNRGQSPSVESDERQTVINRATQAANWCVQILREFLVVADAPAGTDESPTCRTAVFENVKGNGFQQQLAEPLWKAAEYVSSESNREVVSQFDGDPDRSLIASVDAWSNGWHDLASHVLADLAENANRILSRDVVIDYRDASEDDLSYFKLTMYGRRIPGDWFDVLFFVKHQWRFRSIRLDQIENGILRENLRSREARKPPPANTDGLFGPDGFRLDGIPVTGLANVERALLNLALSQQPMGSTLDDVGHLAEFQSWPRPRIDKLLSKIKKKFQQAKCPRVLRWATGHLVFREPREIAKVVKKKAATTPRPKAGRKRGETLQKRGRQKRR